MTHGVKSSSVDGSGETMVEELVYGVNVGAISFISGKERYSIAAGEPDLVD